MSLKQEEHPDNNLLIVLRNLSVLLKCQNIFYPRVLVSCNNISQTYSPTTTMFDSYAKRCLKLQIKSSVFLQGKLPITFLVSVPWVHTPSPTTMIITRLFLARCVPRCLAVICSKAHLIVVKLCSNLVQTANLKCDLESAGQFYKCQCFANCKMRTTVLILPSYWLAMNL